MKKKQMITVHQFQEWHPEKLVCSTDFAYTRLANAIFDEIAPYLEFMNPDERPGVAIGIAHYIEDIISETHQMEVFMNLYQMMYGYALPFFDDDEEKKELYKMAFVVWHCICGQRTGHFINPVTAGVALAEKTLHFVDDARTIYGCTQNDDLAGFIYSEESLDDAIIVKSVIMWIENRSFLGRWQNNRPEDDPYLLEKMFPGIDDGMLIYGNASIQAFDNMAWPLSLPAQHIYAEMIRTEVDDPDDEMAMDVENIKFRTLGMCHGLKAVDGNILMEDCRGEQFMVDGMSGSVSLLKSFRIRKYIMGAFFQYRDMWNICGVNGWMDMSEREFHEWAEKENKSYSFMHDYVHQYDDFIAKHDGQRMFYFRSLKDYKEWQKSELGVKNSAQGVPSDWEGESILVVFFEPNGQTTLSFCGELLKDENNPYYDEDKAEDGQFELVVNNQQVSPTLLQYALAHDMLSLAAMNDRRGAEYGWQLFQNNIEFFARCFRRDIKTTDVFCPRRTLLPSEWPKYNGDVHGMMTKQQFISELNSHPYIRSKSAKEWTVFRADDSVVALNDEKEKVVALNTADIYKAYRALYGKGDYTSAAVAPYVSKKQLSAATAIVYSLCGGGLAWRNMHKLFDGKSMEEILQIITGRAKGKS